MEQGRNKIGRAFALRVPEWHQDDSGVRRYLQRWARATRGPAAWPDLPEQIAMKLYFGAEQKNAPPRAALEADTTLILNPVVRC